MELPCAGRVAVITGGAQGIGKAIAEKIGHAGGSLMLVDLNPTALTATVDELKSRGINAHAFVGDVSKSADVNRVIDEIIVRASRIDFLVSELSSYITGEILDVNGGILMD
jgi:3-oxoacyl-[acyl-carrier protein] reductase